MEYLSPDVFLEEVPSGEKPIELLGSSTAAFVGHAEKGPLATPIPITNFGEYRQRFGGFIDDGYLPFAVRSYFAEGGPLCYVVRTCHYGAGGPTAVASNGELQNGASQNVVRVEASSRGTWGDEISVEVRNPVGNRFDLVVFHRGAEVESHEGLDWDTAAADPAWEVVERNSNYVRLSDSTAAPVGAPPLSAATLDLDNGDDGLASLETGDYIGTSADRRGLHALDGTDDVRIVCVPDAVKRAVHAQGMAWCEARGDCFYLADSQESFDTVDDLIGYKQAQGAYSSEGPAFGSKYGALYAPWIEVADPRTGGRLPIPPSAAIAGRFGVTDFKRGPHKIAAGILDGVLGSALGLRRPIAEAEQALLNPKGICVIRPIDGVGNVIWGARTVSSDPEWRYTNVRRLMIQIEISIRAAMRSLVMESNDPALWKTITRSVSGLLRRVWLQGWLVGETEDRAFEVKCDAETNPPESIAAGRVVTEVGVAPSKPGEFIHLRVSQGLDEG